MLLRDIFKNLSALIMGELVYKILNFISFIIIARLLGAVGFGKLSIAISFVWLFNALADFGLKELLIRETAGKNPEYKKEYASYVLGMRVLLATITFVLIIAISLSITSLAKSFILILLMGITLIFSSFTTFYKSIFHSFEKMEYEAFSQGVDSVLKLVLVFTILKWAKFDVFGAAAAILLSSLAAFIFTAIICKKVFLWPSIAFKLDAFRTLFKKSIPYFILTFFCIINFRIDIIMVSWLLGDFEAGLISAATKFVESMLIFPFMVAVALFPVMARISNSSISYLRKIYDKALRILFLASLLIAFGLFFGVTYIVPFFFGKQYAASVFVSKILCLTLIPFSLKFLLERFLLIIQKPFAIFTTYFIATAMHITLNLYFIPRVGFSGVAFSTLISEFLIIFSFFYWVNKYMPKIDLGALKGQPVIFDIEN
ncbi:MAG: hypothetical protein DRP74_01955 [Candidatus Omnitrophota bacterium]|nr:MAG: hypothetical protein DRP74_01955 [Candidatus Omnitrophota bacterium]